MRVKVSVELTESVDEIRKSIKHQMESRAYRVANEIRNSALDVLRGKRSGRRYRVPGTKAYYTASAPGEPPAVRTGAFRLSWQPEALIEDGKYTSSIKTNQNQLADWLENGTPGGQMAPRPYHDRILADVEPKSVRIYSEPYFKG